MFEFHANGKTCIALDIYEARQILGLRPPIPVQKGHAVTNFALGQVLDPKPRDDRSDLRPDNGSSASGWFS